MQIHDHAFLVTGGASGLGAACVRRLVDQGANVAIADVNAVAGQSLQTELAPLAIFVNTDVTNDASVQSAIDETLAAFHGLHGVVNCAGIVIAERVLGQSAPHRLDAFSKVISVNLIGTFNVIRLAAFVMARQEAESTGERGVIVNTASIAAYDGQIGQAAYSASKGGVAAMTLPIARELARFGIRVASIAPGIFETPMLGQLSEKIRQSLADQIPFPKRLGRPDEYAALVAHIVENEMLNGEVIRLDGAIRMGPK